MKIFFKSIIVTVFLVLSLAFYLTFYPTQILAVGHTLNPTTVNENTPTVTIEFNGLVDGKKYYVTSIQKASGGDNKLSLGNYTAAGGKISLTACGNDSSSLKLSCGADDYFHGGKAYKVTLSVENSSHTLDIVIGGEFTFTVERFTPVITLTGGATKSDQFTITINGSRRPANNSSRNKYTFDLSGKAVDGTNISTSKPGDLTVPPSGTGERIFGPLTQNGDYTLKVKYSGDVITTFTIKVTDAGGTIGGGSTSGGASVPGENPCPGGICETAIGEINAGDPSAFVGRVLTIAIGLAGGIALIIMVFGSIKILMSGGDPKNVAAGRELIVAAVSGLLFLILSVLILRFIGSTLLPTNPF